MKNDFRGLMNDSLIYGAGIILTRSTSFFTLPYYTNRLTVSDYGTLEFFFVTASFISIILTLGFDSSFSYYYSKYEDRVEKSNIFSITLYARSIFCLSLIVLSLLSAPIIQGFSGLSKSELVYFSIYAISSVFLSQSLYVFRLDKKPFKYVLFELMTLTLSHALIITSFELIAPSVDLYLSTFIGVNFFVSLVGIYTNKILITKIKNFKHTLIQLLKFGLPLLPSSFSIYFMNTLDRWFIKAYLGDYDLGVYAVAAKFSLVATIIINTFRQAWWPYALKGMNDENGAKFFAKIGDVYVTVFGFLIVGISFISPWALKYLTPMDYHEAYPTIAILSWSSFFYGSYLIFGAGIWKAEKTIWTSYCFGISSLINLGANFVLVRELGYIGAALSTLLSYIVMIIISYFISQRLWKVPFDKRKLFFKLFIQLTLSFSIIFWHKNNMIVLSSLVTLIAFLYALHYLINLYRNSIFND